MTSTTGTENGTQNGIVNALTTGRLPRWAPWALLVGSWLVFAVAFGFIQATSDQAGYNITGVVFFGTVLFDVLLFTVSYLVEGIRNAPRLNVSRKRSSGARAS
ncbi:MAG TPA: hypothetical protein VL179_13730, partial [Mycobacterium sp.]|nr:hypothetical protein [Mycobacterium sp.]